MFCFPLLVLQGNTVVARPSRSEYFYLNFEELSFVYQCYCLQFDLIQLSKVKKKNINLRSIGNLAKINMLMPTVSMLTLSFDRTCSFAS